MHIKSEKLAQKVIEATKNGDSYRKIAKDFSISKNTVISIIKRYNL
jgi:transposase